MAPGGAVTPLHEADPSGLYRQGGGSQRTVDRKALIEQLPFGLEFVALPLERRIIVYKSRFRLFMGNG